MTVSKFYDRQDDLTAAKIRFYSIYIERYLFKLLCGFHKCFVADLFCGPGKNGSENGSPLVLIDRLNYILTSPYLKKYGVKIFVLFNDYNDDYVKNLDTELKKINIDNNIKFLGIKCKDFADILKDIKRVLKDVNIPKFFFLDPFTYSNISMDNLKDLMALKYTEVLFFLPAFHCYRFKNADFNDDHKVKIFLEEFTLEKTPSDYDNFDAFMASIKEKIKSDLGLKFVRPVILDAGSRKNALFLLTKNRAGIALMNNICFTYSENGKGINLTGGEYKKQSFFGTLGTAEFKKFAKNLEDELKK
ncbi:MAG: three-Cys-motif partner protein TcmP, partial [bacterium]|nr:three-Cys-motif partner protein TcmP [bacterium]